MVSARFSNVVSEALYLSENLPLKSQRFSLKMLRREHPKDLASSGQRSISSLYSLGTFSSMKKSLIFFLDPPPTDIQSPFFSFLQSADLWIRL